MVQFGHQNIQNYCGQIFAEIFGKVKTRKTLRLWGK